MPIFGIYNTESNDYVKEWTASPPARYSEPSSVFEGGNIIVGAPAYVSVSENTPFSAQNGGSSNVPQIGCKIIEHTNSDDTTQDTVSLLDPDKELRTDIFSPWTPPELQRV